MLEDNICVVPACKTSFLKAKSEGKEITFFTLPKDPILLDRWMEICKCKDKAKSGNNLICSQHFKPEDFKNDKNVLLLNTTQKKLKKNAIPSLFLEPASEIKQDDRSPLISTSETIHNLKKHFQQEKDFLKMKIADLENEEYLNKLIIYEIDKKIDREYAEFESYVKFALNQLPEVDQVHISVNKIIKLKWTSEGMEKPFSITLKHVSDPLYMYIRDTLHYPLPTLPVLKKWIENMKNRKKIRKGKFSKFKKTFWYLKQLKKC